MSTPDTGRESVFIERMFSDLLEYIESRRKIIEERISEEIRGYEEEIAEITHYIVHGGKRLRGVLTILVTEALGGSIDKAIDASIAIELVHSASLALDDIIDGDLFRRGRPSSWIKFGISQTVLVSNFLIPKAQLMIRRYGFEALVNVIQAWLHATLGEILDSFGRVESPLGYEKIVDLKTASVFKMAAYLGAKAAGVDDRLVEIVSEYGEYLGRLYQVADDLVDLITRDPRKMESNSMRLFIKWLGGDRLESVSDRAVSTLLTYLSKCIEKTSYLPRNRYTELLKIFPVASLYMILREAGEEGVRFFYEKIYPSVKDLVSLGETQT